MSPYLFKDRKRNFKFSNNNSQKLESVGHKPQTPKQCYIPWFSLSHICQIMISIILGSSASTASHIGMLCQKVSLIEGKINESKWPH